MTPERATDLAWAADAACAGRGDDQVPADTCARCPVRVTCLEHALVLEITTGTWGGYRPAQRAALLDTAGGDVAEALIADHHRHPLADARTAARTSPHPADHYPQLQLPLH